MRALTYADDAADLASLARFVERAPAPLLALRWGATTGECERGVGELILVGGRLSDRRGAGRRGSAWRVEYDTFRRGSSGECEIQAADAVSSVGNRRAGFVAGEVQ